MFEIHRIFKMKSNTTSKIGIMGKREKIVRKAKNEKKPKTEVVRIGLVQCL